MKKVILTCIAVIIVLNVRLYAKESTVWTEDFAKAVQKAEKKGKHLLLDFTGSDWCGWCKRLDSEVFSKPVFKKEAPGMFVLVKLDFPRRSKLPAKIKKQNDELQKKYGVKGFPTILLADAAGKPYAKTGYRRGGAKKYIDHLKDLKKGKDKIDRLFAEAQKKEGLEKAKALDKALEHLYSNGIEQGYGDVVEQIIELDSSNKAGLKLKYEIPKKLQEIGNAFNKSRNADKALAEINGITGKLKDMPELLQQVLVFKAQVVLRGKGDMKGALKILKKAKKTAPGSSLDRQISYFIRQIESRLKK